MIVSVHGALTYAGKWDDQFVIGFDTNHMSDFSPWGYYDQKMIDDGIKNFKNLKYVLDQAQDLAEANSSVIIWIQLCKDTTKQMLCLHC